MTASGVAGLIFVLFFLGLVLIFILLGRNGVRPGRQLREIPAFDSLKRAVGLAVEAGARLHLSLGRGNITGQQSAVGLVGLSMLERIARSTTAGDRPPVATSGEGSLAVLSQDTLRGAARYTGAAYDPLSGRLTGVTPFSYAAGVLPVIHDEDVGASLLVGNFGSEIALITEASERAGSLTLAGTDNLPGQAVLYASAQEPLIGEEVFAGGAYLGVNAAHAASLRAQDVLRWLLILAMLLGAIGKLAGLL